MVYLVHLDVCSGKKILEVEDSGTCRAVGDGVYPRLEVEATAPIQSRKKHTKILIPYGPKARVKASTYAHAHI
jgi:hypothetical protein